MNDTKKHSSRGACVYGAGAMMAIEMRIIVGWGVGLGSRVCFF